MNEFIDAKIGIVGLGYVGLPLAVEFGKAFSTIGFDINPRRIKDLKDGFDCTKEVDTSEIFDSKLLRFTNDINDLNQCTIFIITVPTPIDSHKQPDLRPLKNASSIIGKILKKGDIVVYESTVFPGATEEICVPILESKSKLRFNQDFFCGYSPERINPGDKDHRVTNIKKVTSGSTEHVAEIVDQLYKKIILAGTHKAQSIKVAEAAKVIENTQRDINIALINELAIIFNKLNIDTEAVLEAANTKWNFLNFKPGLVGGHCIGIDPYYLTYKAIEVGYHPEIILGGRKLNDSMGRYVAHQLSLLMIKKRIHLVDANILVMGIAFKENCPDTRNSRVLDIIDELQSFNCIVDVYDPLVDKDNVKAEFGINIITDLQSDFYDAIIIAVGHDEFKCMSEKTIRNFGKENHVLYDIKYLLSPHEVDGRL